MRTAPTMRDTDRTGRCTPEGYGRPLTRAFGRDETGCGDRMAPATRPPLAFPRIRLTRFQKLAAATVVTAILLVTIGVIVRATGSGLGCPDWPLCNGRIIPSLDDTKAWIEWIHRTVAVIIGFEVIGLAVLAFLDHRDRRVVPRPTAPPPVPPR